MGKKRKKQAEKDGKTMALSGHLKELRNRLMVCVVCLVVVFTVCLYFAADIVKLLTDIGRAYGYRYVYLSPQELLMEHFGVALVAAVCVTLPVILYQVWAFIRPGLKARENILSVLAMSFGLVCFVGGVYFAYKLMLPFMLEFLIGIREGSGIAASISVHNYISFLLTIFVIFGIVFELPVVSVLLTQLGLVKVEWMKKARKVVIVIIFFVAAVITPPDIVSQIMVAVPMMLLYQFSIILCWALMKFRRKEPEEEEKEDETEEEKAES